MQCSIICDERIAMPLEPPVQSGVIVRGNLSNAF